MGSGGGGSLKRSPSLESFGSDVERITSNTFKKRCCHILIRLGVSAVFMAALAGALIWSFYNGEAGEYRGEVHDRDSSVNFTVFIDQFSESGRLFETVRGPDDGSAPESTLHKSHSVWYQDNSNQMLIHRVSLHTTIYALPSFLYIANTTSGGEVTACRTDKNANYTTYLERAGLTRLVRAHEEEVRIKNKKEVYVYQGNPDKVRLPDSTATAFFVLAYADADTGAFLGWDTYFSTSNDSNLYKREYWYGEMLPAEPLQKDMDVPSLCATSLSPKDVGN